MQSTNGMPSPAPAGDVEEHEHGEVCQLVMDIRNTSIDNGVLILENWLAARQQSADEVRRKFAEQVIGSDESSYTWHTSDASMLNHMRIARNELRAEQRRRLAKFTQRGEGGGK